MDRDRQHHCSGCGATLDNAGAAGLCPACLLSGALKSDPMPHTPESIDPLDPSILEGETDTRSLAPVKIPVECKNDVAEAPAAQPRRRRRVRPAFDLPHELGGYTLVSLLGQGGMGTVYEAVEQTTGRRLALKLLEHGLESPELRNRFLREGRLAARVNHPASVYVFGSEEIDGLPAIRMEIAPGGTLQDVLDRRGPLPVVEAVDAVLNMIDGLQAALDRGVLHRDIKPSNCFVWPGGTVKVGDFGLSVSTQPSADTFVTQTGKVMGTPAFASPQQLRGDEVDARSDIYSVGATLFMLLTGRAPFQGDNAVQVVAHVIDAPPPAVSQFRDGVPAGLNRVIERCLTKEPAGRYRDYAALRDALLPFGSAVPEPATQAQRTAAGWIDYLTAFFPTYAALMIVVGPEAIFLRPLYEFTLAAWACPLLILAMGCLYFALVEGVWGAGLGKWVVRLQVVQRNGRMPGISRALLRIAIPIAIIESFRIPLSIAVLPAGPWGPLDVLLFVGLAVFCPWVVALLWVSARRSNGFATVWDLVTGTRVVARTRGMRRPAGADSTQTQRVHAAPTFRGPFRVASDIVPGQWLTADDPVLRRPVWLMRRNGDGLPEARRTVARTGRPRWLQEIQSEDEIWDAFEAARGGPLTAQGAPGRVPWSTVRYWLHDLAEELHSAKRDGTLPPAVCLDQVWITDDGRALLLDAPWPSHAPQDIASNTAPGEPMPVQGLAAQQRFLQAIAEYADPLTVPLHAQPALQNLRCGSYEKLTYLAGTLRGLLSKPADVTRGLRAASLLVIPGYAWAATLLGIAGNTDPSVGPGVWSGRIAIAGLVMMHIIAVFDLLLAFWQKSTGLTTFGLEAITAHGRASRRRMLARGAIMWLPVLGPTGVLAALALTRGAWIGFELAALVGWITLAGAAVLAASALASPTRGVHDRLAGVWVGRR
ncbi:MAG: protein kinase [Planctomycetota bacterium]